MQTGVKVKQGLWLDISVGQFYHNLFGEILLVLNSKEGVVLCLREWEVKGYDRNLGAFTVKQGNMVAKPVNDIESLKVVPVVRDDSNTNVVPKFSTTIY